MEVELGLKLTKSLEDFASADLLIAKDRAGPLFISRETNIMFILTAHLKGYRREQIKIEINEDGSRIVIRGERPVQDMIMVGWKVYKKDIGKRGFRKSFKIPHGVILDKIKARFNEDESMLKIFMQKAILGIRGDGIEEVKEEEIAGGNSEPLHVEADEKIAGEKSEQKVFARSEAKDEQQEAENKPERREVKGKEKIDMEVGEDEGVKRKNKGLDGNVAEQKQEPTQISAAKTPVVQEYMPHGATPQVEDEMMGKEQVVPRFDETEEEKQQQLCDQSTQTGEPTKSKFCAPIFAGSALLVSLLVFVMHLIRTNNKPSNKKH